MPGDEELETLGEGGILGLALGQGGDLHRIVHDEGGLHQAGLHILVKERGKAVALAGGLFHMYAALLAHGAGFLVAGPGGPVLAAGFLHRVGHGDALPGGLQVDYLTLVGHIGGAQGLHGHELVELLHHLHDFLVVGVGLVGLHAGELRVVGGVHALVAEDAAHLVHPLKAAHDQALEVQLGFNAQEHGQVEGVVVGAEGPGRRADFQRVQHGGVHLQVAPAVQELAHGGDDGAALAEGVAHLGVHNAVHIPLAVAQVGIHQAVELLRQHLEGLAQQGHGPDVDGDFPRLGAEGHAGDAQNVADVVLLEGGVLVHAQVVPGDVDLDVALPVQQMGEGSLAHDAAGGHAARQGHLDTLHGLEVVNDLPAVMGHIEAGDLIGVFALVDQGLQLLPADDLLLGQLGGEGRYGIISHVGTAPVLRQISEADGAAPQRRMSTTL